MTVHVSGAARDRDQAPKLTASGERIPKYIEVLGEVAQELSRRVDPIVRGGHDRPREHRVLLDDLISDTAGSKL